MDIVVLMVICLAVVAHALADGNGDLHQVVPNFQQNFKDLDTNSDGKVSQQEYSASFLKEDKNGDGRVTLQEYTQEEPLEENKNILAEEFSFHDINSDGVIAADDLSQRFQTIDTNGDGNIEQGEFIQYATHLFVNHLHPAFAVGK